MDHSDDKADPHQGDAENLNADENAAGPRGTDEPIANEAGDRATGSASSGYEASGGDRAESSKSASARPTGSDLSALDSGLSDLAPFFPRPEASGAAGSTRGRFASLIDFASNAALVACVLGFAFAAGTYVFGGAPGSSKAVATAATHEDAERIEMLRTTQKMVADMNALKTNVEALRVSLAQEQAASSQRGFEKSLDALKTKLDAVRTETSGQLAELSGKVDRLQHDPALQQVAERLDRIEKQTSSMPTGSVAPLVKAATQDRGNVAQAKSTPAADEPKRPTLITSWVVRDVYNGVALVENARGSLEVALGDTIPGAGTVKSIERRGGGWIVITSRGLVDYDHSIMVP
ncbi:hypothetical protein [Methylocella sp.]|jgi:hypothetical protein|uniref:hypothetical protein n=1 Tax=Methylocella sp. TaxID=1978226 RepID=UPI003C273431